MTTLLRSLKALADESRLRILWMLEDGPLCVCEIQEVLALAQSTVSRHLQILEEVGFVVSEKNGPWKHYRLNPLPQAPLQALLATARLAAASEEEARSVRKRARDAHREDLCSAPSAA